MRAATPSRCPTCPAASPRGMISPTRWIWRVTRRVAGSSDGRAVPHASNIADVKPDEPDGIVSLISLDMDAYAEKYGSKAVRKNVTIPAWLDTFGERNNINYSQVLREGLESRYRALQDA